MSGEKSLLESACVNRALKPDCDSANIHNG